MVHRRCTCTMVLVPCGTGGPGTRLDLSFCEHTMPEQQKVLLRAAVASPSSSAAPPTTPSATQSPAQFNSSAAAARKSAGPRKLLNDNLELSLDEVTPLLSDSVDFTVIGVLGAQGVGKSNLLSLLAGARWVSQDGSLAGGSVPVATLHDPIFAPQTKETALGAAHQTCGVDLHVTAERLLLLDTQPLLSPSVLVDLIKREAALPTEVQTHENLLELHSLRIAMFMLSVCHVVVWAVDAELDAETARLIRVTQMLRHRLPDLAALATATPSVAATLAAATAAPVSASAEDAPLSVASSYSPTLAFLFNRAQSCTFAPSQRASLRALLRKLVTNTPARDDDNRGNGGGSGTGPAGAATAASGGDNASVTLAGDGASRAVSSNGSESGTAGNSAGNSGECGAATAAGSSSAAESELPAVVVLPDGSTSKDAPSEAHLGYRAEAEAVRDALLALRRRPFSKALTEREWLKGAARMWDLVRRSALLASYNVALQKLHLYA